MKKLCILMFFALQCFISFFCIGAGLETAEDPAAASANTNRKNKNQILKNDIVRTIVTGSNLNSLRECVAAINASRDPYYGFILALWLYSEEELGAFPEFGKYFPDSASLFTKYPLRKCDVASLSLWIMEGRDKKDKNDSLKAFGDEYFAGYGEEEKFSRTLDTLVAVRQNKLGRYVKKKRSFIVKSNFIKQKKILVNQLFQQQPVSDLVLLLKKMAEQIPPPQFPNPYYCYFVYFFDDTRDIPGKNLRVCDIAANCLLIAKNQQKQITPEMRVADRDNIIAELTQKRNEISKLLFTPPRSNVTSPPLSQEEEDYNRTISMIGKRYTSLKDTRLIDKRKVKHLDLRDLHGFPDKIFSFDNLESLQFNDCKFTDIPEGLANLKKLRILVFVACEFNALPKDFGNLKQLGDLSFNSCGLTDFPEQIFNLYNLRRLELVYNKIKSIPNVERFKRLKHLKVLTIKENIPESQIEAIRKIFPKKHPDDKFPPTTIKRLDNRDN